MYDLVLSDKAKKQLKKLTSQLQHRIGFAIERIKIRPHHFIKRKVGTPHYILRVGDYRLILDIKKQKLLILVLELGPRKQIYSG
tara:strand:+ start:157 stop:408 length:252 start_codon:yes stop_codon:yes gene_type:complete